MDIFELTEEEQYGDEFPHKNPRRVSKKRRIGIKEKIIRKAIGNPRKK